MVTRREEALGAVKLYPGEPYVGDASVAASPSLQWTGSDTQFVDSDLLVLFRNVASLVPVAGPILAPALAYVKDIVICVKTVKDNRRQAEALATDLQSFAQGLLQAAKDAGIRLLPDTPVAHIVIQLELRLQLILEKIRICQEPSANKFSKAFKQFFKRDEIAAILSDGREELRFSMAAFTNELLLPMAFAAESQSQLKDAEFLKKLVDIAHAKEIEKAIKTDGISSDIVQQEVKQISTGVATELRRRATLPPGQAPDAEAAFGGAHCGPSGVSDSTNGNQQRIHKNDLNTLEALRSRLQGLYLDGDGGFLDDDTPPQVEQEDLGGAQYDAHRILTLLDELCDSREGVTASGVEVIKVLKDVGTGLAYMGLHEEAVSVLTILVAQCRADQAKENSIKTRVNMATSLIALSAKLGGVGRFAEGLGSSEEGVQLFEDLYRQQPKRFLKSLADACLYHSWMLTEAGRYQDAATASERCVTLCREGALLYALDLKPTLARGLGSQSSDLVRLGSHRRAMMMAEEAVSLYQALVKERGSIFHADLAKSLNKYSVRLSYAGQHRKAMSAIKEAVDLCRALVEERGSVFHADLARSLNDYSNQLSSAGEHEKAMSAIEEVVNLCRALIQEQGSVFRASLAASLNNYSNKLFNAGEQKEAMSAIKEAVSLYRALVEERGSVFHADLARSLSTYSARLFNAGEHKKALEAIEDAIQQGANILQIHGKRAEISKLLYKQDSRWRSKYAKALSDYVGCLSNSDEPVDFQRAVQSIEEAVELYEKLYTEDASRWRADYAKALSYLAGHLSRLDHPGDSTRARQISEKAVELYKQLYEEDPSRWRSDYAKALSDYAGHLSDSGQRGDFVRAVLISEKAIELYKQLYEEDPSRWRSDYAKALSDHAGHLSKSYQPGGFARAVQESQTSVKLFKRLSEEDIVQWKKRYEDAQESHASYLRIFEELKSPYPMVRYVLSPVSISVNHLVVALKKTNEQTRQLAEELEQIIRKVVVDLVASVKGTDNVLSVDSEFNIMTRRLDSDLVRILKDIGPDSQRWRFLAPWKTTKTVLARAKEEFAVLNSSLCARPNKPGHVQPTLDLNRFSSILGVADLLEACNSSIPFVAATIRPVLISLTGILISVQDSDDDDARRQGAALAVEILKPVKGFVDLFNGGDFIRSPDFAFAEAMRKLGDDLFELRSDVCTRQRASGHWWRIFVARKSVESLLVSGHKAFMANTKQAEMDVLYERYAGQPRPTPEDASPNPPSVDMESRPVP